MNDEETAFYLRTSGALQKYTERASEKEYWIKQYV
jgi:hypothetical protein